MLRCIHLKLKNDDFLLSIIFCLFFFLLNILNILMDDISTNSVRPDRDPARMKKTIQ